MPMILRRNDQERSAGATVLLEAEAYGAPVSLFLLDTEEGAGPDLHRPDCHHHAALQ